MTFLYLFMHKYCHTISSFTNSNPLFYEYLLSMAVLYL